MPQKLAGKVAVITGGSCGIGLATAKRFVDEGACAFITGRPESEPETAVSQIGHNVVGIQGDVSKIMATCGSWRRRLARTCFELSELEIHHDENNTRTK